MNPRRAEAKMGTSRLISIVVLAGFGLSLSGCLSLVDERGHIDFDLDGKHAAREARRAAGENVPEQDVQGVDGTGRIPKAKLPKDLKNPERWRYIPEGKILEGNFLERFLVSSFISPVFFFESDVGMGGGVGVSDFDFRHQRRREFAGMFGSITTEGQQRFAMAWRRRLYHQDLPDGGVIQEERSTVGARGAYSRTLTRRFFGLGDDTRAGDETDFTDQVFSIGGDLNLSFPDPGSNSVFSVGARYENHHLGRGALENEPNTKDTFPVLFDGGDDHESFWLSSSLRYDTRDSQHNPYEGVSVGLSANGAPAQTHGDAGMVWRAFANGVITVPGLFHSGGDSDEENPPTDTLGASVFVEDTAGNLPFWALPSLGGSETLRGYIQNRWTDEAAWHSAVEWRFWVLPRGIRFTDHIRVERVGLAPFVEAGSVNRRVENVFEGEVRWSYGLGFRTSFERTVLLRADLGFSNEGPNFTFGFGLTF